jgi:hypothetical protein
VSGESSDLPQREGENEMSNKQRAEINVITNALHEWHRNRTSQKQCEWSLGECCNEDQITRLLAIHKMSYQGIDGLRERVTKEYLAVVA